MAVFRMPNGTWRAQAYLNGKRIATRSGFPRKGDAERWEEEERARYRQDGAAPRERYTFEDALRVFESRHLPHLGSSESMRRYRSDIKLHIAPYFRFHKLDQLSPDVFDGFKAALAGKLSPSTANNVLLLTHLVLERAVRAKLLKENPYDVELLPVPKGDYDWWDSKETIRAFLQTAQRYRYYGAYYVALGTGLRLGEVQGLWKDAIDFSAGRIYVQRQWKEGIKDYTLPKYGKRRWVYFDPKGELADALRQAKRESKDPRLMFPTKGGQHVTKMNLSTKYLRVIQRKAGVPPLTFHGQRHTFASWYMIERDNIWNLMALLGHSDIQTTMRYAHLSKSRALPGIEIGAVTQESHTRPRLEVVNGGS